MSAYQRQALIAELIEIRAWEHRYQDFDALAARGREIQDALAATNTERRAA